MEVTTTAGTLSAALTTLIPFIHPKGTLEILRFAHLTADGECLHLFATNLELSYQGPLEGDIVTEGAMLLDVAPLLALVRTLSSDASVTLRRTDGHSCRVRYPGGTALLQGRDAMEYPERPGAVQKHTAQITAPAAVWIEGISATRYAVSADATRPVLSTIAVAFPAHRLLCTSTDGHRLAHWEGPSLEGQETSPILLPASGADALLGLGKTDIDAPWTLTIYPNVLQWQIGVVQLTVTQVQGVFPEWERVIPQTPTCSLTLETAAVHKAIQRMLGLGRSRDSKAVPLLLTLQPDRMILVLHQEDGNQAQEAIPGTSQMPWEWMPKAPDYRVLMNAVLIEQAIRSISTDQVTFILHGNNVPLMLCPGEARSSTHFALLMPMRDEFTHLPDIAALETQEVVAI